MRYTVIGQDQDRKTYNIQSSFRMTPGDELCHDDGTIIRVVDCKENTGA